MLRIIVYAIGAALLAAAIYIELSAPAAWPGAVECAIFGILIIVGTALEGRYRSQRSMTSSDWTPTEERFVDPSTGRMTEVFYNSATGERSYKPSGDKGPHAI